MSFGNLFRSLAVVIIVGGTSLVALRAQRPSTPIHEQPRYKKWPITDFDKPGPSDPEGRKLRKAKGDRFGLLDKSIDPRRFAITEDRESSFGSPPSHSPAQPALPVDQGNAILIAEVKAGEAFLSTDQTTIYSEFTLSVAEVIRHGSSAEIVPGSTITAVRGGGGVRFPSGKIVLQGYNPEPLPEIGSKYLLFLTEFDSEHHFLLILTAYEIRAGKVFPLDGRGSNGWLFPEYAEHQKFAGMDETAFIYFVRQAIQARGTVEGVQ